MAQKGTKLSSQFSQFQNDNSNYLLENDTNHRSSTILSPLLDAKAIEKDWTKENWL